MAYPVFDGSQVVHGRRVLLPQQTGHDTIGFARDTRTRLIDGCDTEGVTYLGAKTVAKLSAGILLNSACLLACAHVSLWLRASQVHVSLWLRASQVHRPSLPRHNCQEAKQSFHALSALQWPRRYLKTKKMKMLPWIFHFAARHEHERHFFNGPVHEMRRTWSWNACTISCGSWR